LSEGDSLLLFTDGLNELRNSDNIETGFEPLANILRNNSQSADDIMNNIKQLIKEATVDITIDDITALSLVFKGKNIYLNKDIINYEVNNIVQPIIQSRV
jgi:serine phosphatase RsbU (regulator of sigma subunit)